MKPIPKDIRDISTHPRYRSGYEPVPLPKSLESAKTVLGLTIDEHAPKAFTFRRCKERGEWRCSVGLKMGALWVCLSSMLNHYPKNFAEGRAWAAEWGQQYGIAFRECSWLD